MKSDTSACSPESEDLNSVSIMSHSPRTNDPKKGGSGPLISNKHSFTIDRTPHYVLNQLDSQKLTNTPQNSSPKSSRQLKIGETAQKLIQVNYQTLICSVEDFLANHSQSLENGEVLKIPEGQCFLRLQEYLKLKDLKLYSLKTSKGYSITKKGKLSPSSWKRWMNWGMKLNGWYLTANFSEFPRTERGYSLSEVLEENPDQKYYLSEESTQRLISKGLSILQSPKPLEDKEVQENI